MLTRELLSRFDCGDGERKSSCTLTVRFYHHVVIGSSQQSLQDANTHHGQHTSTDTLATVPITSNVLRTVSIVLPDAPTAYLELAKIDASLNDVASSVHSGGSPTRHGLASVLGPDDCL